MCYNDKKKNTADMTRKTMYTSLISELKKAFGNNLKAVVLFGSRARRPSRPDSDHDIFLIIDHLSTNPLHRLKTVRKAIQNIPLRVNTVAKTQKEFQKNLTPLILEVSVDGLCLYGKDYFEPYRKKALRALNQAGLKRKKVGTEWSWLFEKVPKKEWELNWEGYRELS